ncbi:reticulon-4 isoform X3 [Microcaecilia unicolor]|uniref:Reticulon n=1 Tax=Microcaecilia unicolor TaxID=1415580 RepID=A0A6P7X817_9AMPH|nr:reticulon-4 isoform X3 [Microcaecilia unicolor]
MDAYKSQSPEISSTSPQDPHRYPREPEQDEEEEDEEEEEEEEEDKPRFWEHDDDGEVLDLTGGAGDYSSHPPFTVSFPSQPRAAAAAQFPGSEGGEKVPDRSPQQAPEVPSVKPPERSPEPSRKFPERSPEPPSIKLPERSPEPPSIKIPKWSPEPSIKPPVPRSTSEEPAEPVLPRRRGSSGSAVVDLLYWRDIKKTGVVFGASLFLLLSLTVFSIVSVSAYIALALLSVSISFRIYKGVLQAVQKSDEGHPFRAYLDSNIGISEELVQKYSNVVQGHVNCTAKELRRLFLVEDLVDSLKFAVLMWIMTYVGALFNGLTLMILALISLFSIPVIYERHQAQIDHYLELVNKNIKNGIAKIQAKIPGLKRKAE